MNIGLISDTHGKYYESWKQHFERCDALLHAGDFETYDCYEWFMKLQIPFYAVKGNCDRGAWAAYLPASMNIPFEGKLFHLIHNRSYLPLDLDEIDYVIFGHTHIPHNEKMRGIQFINPGSAGIDRGAGLTMSIIHLSKAEMSLEKIIL